MRIIPGPRAASVVIIVQIPLYSTDITFCLIPHNFSRKKSQLLINSIDMEGNEILFIVLKTIDF